MRKLVVLMNQHSHKLSDLKTDALVSQCILLKTVMTENCVLCKLAVFSNNKKTVTNKKGLIIKQILSQIKLLCI